MSFTLHKPTRHRSICLPYCCTGSQRISDSDISDYEIDDGIGVVPPGAWARSMALLYCASLLVVTASLETSSGRWTRDL